MMRKKTKRKRMGSRKGEKNEQKWDSWVGLKSNQIQVLKMMVSFQDSKSHTRIIFSNRNIQENLESE